MLPPLAERELRVALLRHRAHKQWVAAAWIAAVFTGLFLFSLESTGGSRGGSGVNLFRGLYLLQLAVIVARGFRLTADLFSEERRNGTLSLLVLTGLKPWEIFSGKLLGASLLTAHAMIGTLPFLAIPMLAGGVTSLQFVGALVTLLNALLFCVALGVLASVVSREGGHAFLSAVTVALVVNLATPVAYWVSGRLPATQLLPDHWLTLSPGYAPWLVLTSFAAGSVQLFWATCGMTLVCSLACLLLAAFLLQRTWRDSPEEFARRTPILRWRNWLCGSRTWRKRLRAGVLDTQPFVWLAARDPRFVVSAWLIIGGVALTWAAMLLLNGRNGPLITTSIIASMVLHQGLNWCLAYSAALPLSAERQSGGFETLLTTPLTTGQIVAGQHTALRRQFNSPLLAAQVLDVVFICSVALLRDWPRSGFAWYTTAWIVWIAGWAVAHRVTPAMAMWVGAWTGRPAYAAVIAMRPGILLMLTLMPVKSPRILADKLARELPLIACTPIPARGDRRFASWNPEEIFPPGRWGHLELREPKGRNTWSDSVLLFPSGRRNKRL